MIAGVLVGKSNRREGKKPPEVMEPTIEASVAEPLPKALVSKGKPKSTKLYELHTKQLSELAREESLEGGSAEAFDKHFGALLHNKLIAAKAARLKKLQDETGA